MYNFQKQLWRMVIAAAFILPAAAAHAETPFICGQPTGETAPELTYVLDDNREQRASLFNQEIIRYLNTTGSAEGLEAAIEAANPDKTFFFSAEVVEGDFTGDDLPDVLVNTRLVYGIQAGFDSAVSLLTCTPEGYRVQDTVVRSGFDGTDNARPTSIIFVADSNNNHVPEIFLRATTVEGMKIHDSVAVYEWDGTGLVEIFEFGPDYGVFSDISLMNADANPATLELRVGDYYGYGQATAMAVIEISHSRPIDIVFGWQGSQFQERCRYFTDVPTTLYETLHSAETHRACGDYDAAMETYWQLWSDSQLTAWEAPWINIPENITDEAAYAADLERAYLRAFAGYRRTQFYLVQGNIRGVEAVLKSLDEEYAPASPGYSYAAMADALWQNYQQTGDMDAACAAAEDAFRHARDSGADPGIDHYEEVVDDRLLHFGFYFYSGKRYSPDPDNLFDVPPDISDILSIPVCIEQGAG